MDDELCRLMDANMPKINPAIANGFASYQLTELNVVKYIDSVFRSAAKGFPEGLTYEGGRRCTPPEDFNESSKKKGNNKRTFDVARSDVFMMKYLFKYKGEEITRYINLPFVGDAGSITMSGSRFNISPVLSDRVISVGTDTVFVRLLRDVLTFQRVSQNINVNVHVNGQREQINVAWAMIYHKSAKDKRIRPTIKMHSTLTHYLFCKYGLMKTFEMFAQCKPIIGGPEISPEQYPESDWVICSSTQIKPKGCGKGLYEPSQLRVVVRKDEFARTMVRNMIGGLFYIADHFPGRVRPEYVNNTDTRWMDNTNTWITLMGLVIWGGNQHEGILRERVEEHLRSLDEYIDNIVLMKFKEIGIQATDLYQFMALMIENITDMLHKSSDKVNSMYDKELSVLYFVLKDITSEIFKLYFKLKAASKKELTKKDIEERMNKTISMGRIFSITKQHPEVTTISSSGDNKALKITGVLVPQSSSSKQSGRKDRVVIDDPSRFLHVSYAEIGGYSNLPKSDPIGQSRISPWAETEASGLVRRSPKFFDMLNTIQEQIRRKR
jgi:hypothetical protein